MLPLYFLDKANRRILHFDGASWKNDSETVQSEHDPNNDRGATSVLFTYKGNLYLRAHDSSSGQVIVRQLLLGKQWSTSTFAATLLDNTGSPDTTLDAAFTNVINYKGKAIWLGVNHTGNYAIKRYPTIFEFDGSTVSTRLGLEFPQITMWLTAGWTTYPSFHLGYLIPFGTRILMVDADRFSGYYSGGANETFTSIRNWYFWFDLSDNTGVVERLPDFDPSYNLFTLNNTGTPLRMNGGTLDDSYATMGVYKGKLYGLNYKSELWELDPYAGNRYTDFQVSKIIDINDSPHMYAGEYQTTGSGSGYSNFITTNYPIGISQRMLSRIVITTGLYQGTYHIVGTYSTNNMTIADTNDDTPYISSGETYKAYLGAVCGVPYSYSGGHARIISLQGNLYVITAPAFGTPGNPGNNNIALGSLVPPVHIAKWDGSNITYYRLNKSTVICNSFDVYADEVTGFIHVIVNDALNSVIYHFALDTVNGKTIEYGSIAARPPTACATEGFSIGSIVGYSAGVVEAAIDEIEIGATTADVEYTLYSESYNKANVAFYYNLEDGNGWQAATTSSIITELNSSPLGTPHLFVHNLSADGLAGFDIPISYKVIVQSYIVPPEDYDVSSSSSSLSSESDTKSTSSSSSSSDSTSTSSSDSTSTSSSDSTSSESSQSLSTSSTSTKSSVTSSTSSTSSESRSDSSSSETSGP